MLKLEGFIGKFYHVIGFKAFKFNGTTSHAETKQVKFCFLFYL